MSLPFTTSLATPIGRIRSRLGLTEPGASPRIEDARIQEYIDATTTEYEAALMMVDSTIASLARRIKTTQTPDSASIVQINDAQAQFDAWQTVRKNLIAATPSPVSTGLPVVRFGSLGRHPSDPWCP